MKRHESLRWQRRISGSLQLFYVLYMDGMVNRSKTEQDVILHVENKKKKKRFGTTFCHPRLYFRDNRL